MSLKQKICREMLIALMAGAAFIPTQALAQDAAEGTAEPEGGVADIIVTAQKRAQSINDVGLSITALSSDALDKQGILSMQDMARVVPGLNFADSGFGTPIFTLRGVGFPDNSLSNYPTTSVYVDEVPLPFAVMTAHANLDLERLEVLKGPQGTLFGQNSTGGAINYIAAKPTKDLSAGMDATIGRFGQGEANGYVSGPITDTLGVRIAGQYGYGNGWQKSFTRDDTIGKRNYLNGRLLAVWNPTSSLKIQLNVNGWKDRSDPLAPQFIGISPQLEAPGGVSIVNPRFAAYPFSPVTTRAADWSTGRTKPNGDRSQYQGALRADLEVTDDITLTSITSYTKFKTNQTVDLDGTDVEAYGYNIQGNIKSFNQELRLGGGTGTAFNWVVGANYEKSRTYEDQTQYYSQSTTAAGFGNLTAAQDALSHKRNYAFFASGDYEVLPGVTVKAGGRYTNSRQKFTECNFDTGDGTINSTVEFLYGLFNPGKPFTAQIGDCTSLDPVTFEPSRFNDTLKEDNISWRVGVDYKVNPDLLLYTTVSKGYKAGGWPTTGALLLTSYQAVKQESLQNYEAGFKAQLANRRVSINGAAFWYDYGNKQLLGRYLDVLFGPLPQLTNVPKARIKGMELEFNAVPIEGLQLSAGVTYLDAKVREFVGVNAGGALSDFAGTAIPFTSKWQYIASIDYAVPTGGSFRPFVGATVSGRSSMTAIVGSATGARMLAGFRSSVPLANLYDLPSYTTLDLRAGVEAEDGNWRFTVWGRNVTNEYSATNAIIANDAVVRYPGLPATYGVTFSTKF
jgi:outer membrane receptor protein involved in Fe transport